MIDEGFVPDLPQSVSDQMKVIESRNQSSPPPDNAVRDLSVREVAHEIPEVDAVFRVEQHRNATVPGIDLHVHHLEPESPPPGAPAARLGVLELARAALAPLGYLRVRRAAHPLPVEPAPLEFGQRTLGPPDLADSRSLARLHDHEVAHGEVLVVRQIVLGLERHAQADLHVGREQLDRDAGPVGQGHPGAGAAVNVLRFVAEQIGEALRVAEELLPGLASPFLEPTG